MSPDLVTRGPVRSAAELNQAIRALWTGPGGHPALRLTDEQREEYGRLLAELRQVERGEVVEAA
ncbi:hypothetical protein [Streptomyces sp. XY006]|uniref:hypothetical protein n=1 Tax=Streptomyces sp. XY006 TaxID=2021410 RepID=UPI000B8BCB4B|nr:hypothetical protein [Streptomyces sp. XY006]OXS35367.1 hypothetical protein CHR28_10185 [Streptomyces sp. XY006]